MIDTRDLCFTGFCIYLTIVGIQASETNEPCNKLNCPGPVKYYESLQCKPVYRNPDDCCAIRYDCSHIHNRPRDKCFVNGNVYNIGETLKDEDAQPCDIGCYCSEGYNSVAHFECAAVDCFEHAEPGCYLQQSHKRCCAGPQVCPEKPEDVPKCMVDGKEYSDGDYFEVKGEPNKYCYCMEGYKGENVEPFCYTSENSCGSEMHHITSIRDYCAPTYYYEHSPNTNCSTGFRCQNSRDEVIPAETPNENSNSEEMKCQFGNLTMNIGDELNKATHYDSVCIRCVCEVPPSPTCQRLSDKDCDITVHPPFDNFS